MATPQSSKDPVGVTQWHVRWSGHAQRVRKDPERQWCPQFPSSCASLFYGPFGLVCRGGVVSSTFQMSLYLFFTLVEMLYGGLLDPQLAQESPKAWDRVNHSPAWTIAGSLPQHMLSREETLCTSLTLPLWKLLGDSSHLRCNSMTHRSLFVDLQRTQWDESQVYLLHLIGNGR